ncbi:MAG: hypothetical protein ABIO70_17645, partial [Pseudomonadota bacterium]
MGALAARRLAAIAPGHPALGLIEAGLTGIPFSEIPGLEAGIEGLAGALAQGVSAAGRSGHSALAVAELMDGGEVLRAVAASFRMALTLFADHGAWAVGLEDLEADQRDDAAMRLALLSLLAWRSFPGTPAARAQALLRHAAGRALLGWIAAIDLALAFGMEDEPLDSELLPAVLGPHAEEAFEALAPAVPATELTGAQGVLAALTAPLSALVEACNARIAPIAESLAMALPELDEHTSEAMAAEVEATPAYLVLAARLLVEAGCVDAAQAGGPALAPAPARAPAPPAPSAPEKPDLEEDTAPELDLAGPLRAALADGQEALARLARAAAAP